MGSSPLCSRGNNVDLVTDCGLLRMPSLGSEWHVNGPFNQFSTSDRHSHGRISWRTFASDTITLFILSINSQLASTTTPPFLESVLSIVAN